MSEAAHCGIMEPAQAASVVSGGVVWNPVASAERRRRHCMGQNSGCQRWQHAHQGAFAGTTMYAGTVGNGNGGRGGAVPEFQQHGTAALVRNWRNRWSMVVPQALAARNRAGVCRPIVLTGTIKEATAASMNPAATAPKPGTGGWWQRRRYCGVEALSKRWWR